MARRTPPIPVQVVPPYRGSNAYLKARLIDFDTGGSTLEVQHQTWLREKVAYAAQQSDYTMWLIGYASKLGSQGGDDAKNTKLSNARMNAVQAFAKSVDPNALGHIQGWEALGSSAYNAGATDDSPDMRAIEVHIFIGSPPPPPTDLKPIVRQKPPLPGTGRTTNWAVAAPGGGQGTLIPPLTIGFNVFVFKNKDLDEIRGYICPQVGLGWSYSLKGLGTAKKAIETLITGVGYSSLDFSDITPPFPVTWEELEASLVSVAAAGAGAGVYGYQAAYTTIDSPNVSVYDSSDQVMKTAKRIFSFPSRGKNYQVGVGGAALTGPLKRVD